jgi:hypothetical protein
MEAIAKQKRYLGQQPPTTPPPPLKPTRSYYGNGVDPDDDVGDSVGFGSTATSPTMAKAQVSIPPPPGAAAVSSSTMTVPDVRSYRTVMNAFGAV